MPLLTYKGYFKDGQLILPDNAKLHLPQNGEFSITFIESEEDKKTKRERQREAFEKFLKNIEAIDDEPLGEEFDKIMSERPKFARTPEELDL